MMIKLIVRDITIIGNLMQSKIIRQSIPDLFSFSKEISKHKSMVTFVELMTKVTWELHYTTI